MTRAGRLALGSAAIAVTAAALPGCNLALGAGDYRVGETWGCVGSVTAPEAKTGETVVVTIHATSFTTGAPFEDATIQACGLNDLACATGVAVSKPTDAAGTTSLAVRSGFDGYFLATAADTMESLLYLSRPLVKDTTVGLELGKYSDYTSLVTSVGGTVTPGTGAIWVDAKDCLGHPAEGVRLSLDAPFSQGTDAFYFLNGAPVDVSVQAETTADAIGGFADVEPGRPAITAAIASNDEIYARFTASVRAEGLTVVELMPTPLSAP